MKIRYFLFCLILAICAVFCSVVPVSAAAGDGAYTEKPVIIIDPGHGGMDGGTTAGIRYEKTYNLIIAQYLRDALEEHGGFEVYLTREDDDTDIKFLPRALYIVDYNADLLLSLHCNSSDIPSASGVLAITSVIEKYSAFALGESILSNIAEAVEIRNRGVETRYDTGDSLGVYYWNSEKNWDMPGASYLQTVSDYFSMNTWSSKFGVPSLIIEHGYLSNSGDREIIDKDENLKKIVEAEAQALIEYYYGHSHVFTEEKVVDFPSNCSMNGTKSYHCTVCGLKAETEALPAAPDAHYYRQSASRLATCEEDGYIEYTCQISFNLNDKGYTTPVHTYTETLAKKGHAYRVTEDTQAGHGVDGRHVEYCGNCGDTIVTITPGEPHTYEKTDEVPAACTVNGSITYTCSICGDQYSEEIPAVGHINDENGVCTVCGFQQNAPEPDTEPAENTAETETEQDTTCPHQYETVSYTAPTCEAEGIRVEICSLCGEEKTTGEAALGHDYLTSIDTPAGCEKDGYYRARCLRCGKERIENRPATGHHYVTEAESDTEIVKVCTVCGAKVTETKEQRNLSDALKNPLFIGVCGIVFIQAVLLTAVGIHRNTVHKTERKGNNAIDELDESNESPDDEPPLEE